MLGRIIFFIIISIFIFWCNACDYLSFKHRIVWTESGFGLTVVALMTIPMLVFDLKGAAMWLVLIILEVVYITIYILVYLKLKKEKDRNSK